MPTWLFIIALFIMFAWFISTSLASSQNAWGRSEFDKVMNIRYKNKTFVNILGYIGTGLVVTQLIMWSAS